MSATKTMVLVALVAATPQILHAQADLKFDGSKPVEVNADSFVADLEHGTGSYKGHVVVRQGAVRLSADQVSVLAPGGKASRMEASGHIVVTTSSGAAVGERGIYDVEGRTLHLTGNVVLTKDENVLRGQALDVAMETGEATLVATTAKTATSAAGNGRVQGLFIPKEKSTNPPKNSANP